MDRPESQSNMPRSRKSSNFVRHEACADVNKLRMIMLSLLSYCKNRKVLHFRRFILTLSLFGLILSTMPCFGDEYGKVTTEKVADGVYLFTTSSYGDVGMCGNLVAILT